MKKVSMSLLSVLLTSYWIAIGHTDNFEVDNRVIILNKSNKLEVAAYTVTPLQPTYGMDDPQRSVELDLIETPLLSSLLGKLDESSFSFDSYIGPYNATLVKKYSSVKFDYSKGRLPPSQFLEGDGSGGGLLFIAGPINNERNSVPESSTMLLLGLGLIGLAGYGGRKKFKR